MHSKKTIKRIFFFSSVALCLTACSKKTNTDVKPNSEQEITKPAASKPYIITENFEDGDKKNYASDEILLLTGKWTFNDALIGTIDGDAKNGSKSVRLRNGFIAMNFDIAGLNSLTLKHAKYGKDENSVWQLLMSTDGGKTYAQLGSDVTTSSNALTEETFKINVSGKVRFQIKKSGTSRINLDDITFTGIGDPEIIVKTSTPTKNSDTQPTSGDNSNLLMGNPSGAQTAVSMQENYLIDQQYYIESYSMTKGHPNWVSWHLDASNITGEASRQNNYTSFTMLPSGWYQVQNNDYSGSGFDRGHNCPSADRTSSKEANSSTFIMTNMIPQAPNNNQKTWGTLEKYLRKLTKENNEIYIIMGNYGTGGIGSADASVVNTINNGKINVPSNIWKIAVILPTGDNDISRVTTNTRVIAVDTPNSNNINSDWHQYLVTVRDIEKATGYNFLSNIQQNIQDVIEKIKDQGN